MDSRVRMNAVLILLLSTISHFDAMGLNLHSPPQRKSSKAAVDECECYRKHATNNAFTPLPQVRADSLPIVLPHRVRVEK